MNRMLFQAVLVQYRKKYQMEKLVVVGFRTSLQW